MSTGALLGTACPPAIPRRRRAWWATGRDDSPYHHGSHRALLRPAPDTDLGGAALDAIIVPTVGRPRALRQAAKLARALGCPLLVFCSGRATADGVVTTLAGSAGPGLLAVDVPAADHGLLRFTTAELNRTVTGRRVDTAHKRNLGLLVARMCGWDRVLFLDDDITVDDPADVRRAARLLDRYDSVGLSIAGFPDNSVVCHAHRIGGGWQDTFVGGGALVVDTRGAISFFPETYNEDWFFLVDRTRLRSVAVTGHAVQRAYNPFADPGRAEFEEFGDVLAEGVFWLLDQRRRVKDATEPFWVWFLQQRLLFIDDVTRRIRRKHDLDPEERASILVALKAARTRLESFPAALCMAYLRGWSADRTRWRNVIDTLPRQPSPDGAIAHLGLAAARPTPGAPTRGPGG